MPKPSLPTTSALALALLAGSAVAAPSAPAAAPTASAPQAGVWSGPRRGPGRDAHGPARMLERVLDAVQATPDQRSRIHDIVRQAEQRARPLRLHMRELSQRQLDLLAAPTIDSAAVERVARERAEVAGRLSREAARTELDVAQVLTPQQRAQAHDLLSRRLQRGPGRGDGPRGPGRI